jgi:enterochelin esterase-like enzyme
MGETVRRKNRALIGTAATAGLALAATVAAVVPSGHSSSAAAPPSPPRELNVSCRSPALGGVLPAAVYLPAGYLHGSSRYPVIYFLHGLPAGPSSYKTNAFVAHAVAASGHRAIVVAPQGASEENSDREYLNWAPDENWPAAIAHDLTRCIDGHFTTIAARTGRALLGLSAGGFGAFNIGLRRLGTFAAVESWSGYFAATDPSGLVTLNLGSTSANRKARVLRGRRLNRRVARRPTFIAFYVGRQDTRFLTANILLDRSFTEHHIPHLFEIYQGGHSESLWQRWAPLWLGYALEHLASPTH